MAQFGSQDSSLQWPPFVPRNIAPASFALYSRGQPQASPWQPQCSPLLSGSSPPIASTAPTQPATASLPWIYHELPARTDLHRTAPALPSATPSATPSASPSASPSATLPPAQDSLDSGTTNGVFVQSPSQHAEVGASIDDIMRVIQRGEALVAERRKPDTPASDEPRRFKCEWEGCGRTLSSRGHLTVHLRAHTGEKPYTCEFAGCSQRFSQKANMKTHMRRHTGEKPFKCSYCDKRFVQRSITRTHEKTHERTPGSKKPFVCRLGSCKSGFSSTGNMKQHQNQFHRKEIQRLMQKFTECYDNGDIPDEHREVLNHLLISHENSNKGIKGRGKKRYVSRQVHCFDGSPPSTPVSPFSDGYSITSEQDFYCSNSTDIPLYWYESGVYGEITFS